MSTLRIDFETRSAIDLKKVGVHVYAVHATTDVWCAAFAFDDGPIEVWTPGSPCPPAIRAHLTAGGEIHAYNANFERILWREVMGPKHGWPVPALEQYHCTMAAALAMALPGSLEDCASALGVASQKDMAGYRLMLQMCRPRRTEPDGRIVWWDEPDKIARLAAYCMTDVETERQIAARVLPLRPSERAVWLLDQIINDRGVGIDRPLCESFRRIVADLTASLDAEMKRVTDYAVTACSQTATLTAWLGRQGVPTDSVAKEALEDLLAREDIPAAARRALELRQQAAKASTAKIGAMLDRSPVDGRMRGNLQYHGAGTGRWAARGAQLQNLPRPTIDGKPAKGSSVEDVIGLAAKRGTAALELLYDNPMEAVSACIRGLIVPDTGHRLMSADFSNIEGRVLAWLAGQEDKLEAFRLYDRGEGPDLYIVAAAGIYGTPIKQVQPDWRQGGKVAELALGYQGGVGAFSKMASVYKLKLAALYDAVYEAASPFNRDRAEDAFEQRGKGSGLSREAWLAAELIKLAWRQKNDKIAAFWPDLENAAVAAVADPGEMVRVGPVVYRKSGSFLWCRLPSGRALCYPYAELEEVELPWGGTKKGLVYKSVDQFTKRWSHKKFYGGLAAENITQAVARDVMVEAMLRVEAAGYPTVLTVHDEIVAEPRLGQGSLEEFERLMAVVPPWIAGCPISVAGWAGARYRKG